jgi:hypothetical protein
MAEILKRKTTERRKHASVSISESAHTLLQDLCAYSNGDQGYVVETALEFMAGKDTVFQEWRENKSKPGVAQQPLQQMPQSTVQPNAQRTLHEPSKDKPQVRVIAS